MRLLSKSMRDNHDDTKRIRSNSWVMSEWLHAFWSNWLGESKYENP